MDRAVNLILFFSRRNHNVCIYSFVYSQARRMFALKGSFGFDLIIPMKSLTVVHSLLLLRKKSTKNFDNNVCTPNKLD